MITTQILQNTIDGLKSITRHDFIIVDYEGNIIVTTEDKFIKVDIDIIKFFINSQAKNQLAQGYQYFKIFDKGEVLYILLSKGEDEESKMFAKIATFQIQSLITAYKEKYDKDNFIKNLLLDNLLSRDIQAKAKKLKIELNAKRVLYLIKIENNTENENIGVDIIRSLFNIKDKDFVTAIDYNTIIFIKELKENYTKKDINTVANELYKMFIDEGFFNVYVSIGGVSLELKDISDCFKKGKMALEICKIFGGGHIINYDKLGLLRLIYLLPSNICKMFLDEILGDMPLENLDKEILSTVDKFFENNLKVSETARQLFIHRNTLVYRLEKLQKMTGLDLKNFDDAVVFKIVLLVNKYTSFKD